MGMYEERLGISCKYLMLSCDVFKQCHIMFLVLCYESVVDTAGNGVLLLRSPLSISAKSSSLLIK